MFGELESAAATSACWRPAQHPAAGCVSPAGAELRPSRRLESTPGFANVLLATHELKPGGAERPVVFSLTADWVGRQ